MSVRQRFVHEVLSEEADRMLRRQGQKISSVTVSRSGRLLSSRGASVFGGAEFDGKLTFVHAAYERFLDMKRSASGGKRRTGMKIHNRFVFGMYSSISERLMYGLTDSVVEILRGTE